MSVTALHENPARETLLRASAGSSVAGVPALLTLLRELNDLKRIHVADRQGSIAERLFLRAWARLVRGDDLRTVALSEAAHAVASARLAGIDARVMEAAGLSSEERRAVLERGLASFEDSLDTTLSADLCGALNPDGVEEVSEAGELADLVPQFALMLAKQPRAGATRPGYARVVLEPTENHAEHCAIVAVNGVVAAPLYGADPAAAFLTGLCHHFHNARLPDAGDAGDHLLGDQLHAIMETFRFMAIAELPPELQQPARDSLDAVFRADKPEAMAFQTADVLDRTLEMEWHARSAAFTLDVALHDMDIVHPGPVQAAQQEIMRAAGLLKPSE